MENGYHNGASVWDPIVVVFSAPWKEIRVYPRMLRCLLAVGVRLTLTNTRSFLQTGVSILETKFYNWGRTQVSWHI